jgi:spore coat protein U-like protein
MKRITCLTPTTFMLVGTLAGFFLALEGPAQVQAGTVTSALSVSATMAASCTISTAPVSFGTYTAAQITAQGTVTVQCTTGAPWHISLNKGTNSNGTTPRSMSATVNGTQFNLTYELYKDAGLTQVWGDSDFAGTYGLGSSLAGTGGGGAQNNTVFGKVSANQSVAAGSYTDTVTATVNF